VKILVACEYSGIVRDAFSRAGHDSWSCDLLPTESELTIREGKHIQGDVLNHLDKGWELLIGHPECTYMTNAGVRWLFPGKNTPLEKRQEEKERVEQRWRNLRAAREFFLMLWESSIPKICLENPIPHSHANLPDYSQTIQPWEFGEWETKRTCLWLKNLPPLEKKYRTIEEARIALDKPEGSKPEARIHLMPPGPNRGKDRSKFFPVFAEAMVEAWSGL
jgi:hypothetical protein